MPALEIIVHGRVQGVGFRYFARQTAESCGIRGYVRNQRDGSVKIVATGGEQELNTYCDLIRRGNYYVIVKDMQIDNIVLGEDYEDFSIRF
ncbi:MAG: acylphosphatase [Candidatus Cloacimonetes bacterium]|nr:acylphosphatase [Candidatus Cloacimonadota bacterium]